MKNVLIGHTGFVGSSLKKQKSFNYLYRKKNIHNIKGKVFDLVVCAGAPGQKWLANKNPNEDLKNINNLITNLKTIKTKMFILISTVDVFEKPIKVNENKKPEIKKLYPYGANRLKLEIFVKKSFQSSLIVRLPGLIGEGLKKNIIYDLLNNNNLGIIDSRSIFQFYPIKNLWNDIAIALKNNLELIHLTTTPTSVGDVSRIGLRKVFNNKISDIIPRYDFRTIHANLYNVSSYYQYNKKDIYKEIKHYFKNEPKSYNNLDF